ncbi:MAG TPA: cupin domain-containing protein [Candidatus Udaeobacter sp.]|nr:cupin domain-containing protein [Candidatus Udaeobacter sp.]
MTDCITQQKDTSITHDEMAAFAPFAIADLKQAAASVLDEYKNFVALSVNDHCVRLAVMQREFRWHRHPQSDECVLVLEGELEIDLAVGQTFRLSPGEAFTISARVVHRTRSRTRV